MKRKHIYEIITSFSILLVLCISVGYAAISTNLKVSGTAISKSATWNIYFDNVVVDSDSVTATTSPTINDEKNAVTFAVKLNKLGDEYTFTVDIKNDGSLDAMVNLINVTELTDTQKKYVDLDVTYEDGVEIQKYDFLKSGDTETILVSVKYKEDANLSDLPKTEETLNITVGIEYVQDSDKAKEVNHGINLYKMMKKNADKTTSIDFKVNSGTSGTNGIYTTTKTDSGKPVYYYRGSYSALNNNLIFNNMCWKIIRTTETGGVKIIYNGTPTDGKCTIQTGSTTQIGTSAFNSRYDDNAYVGYMHGDDSAWYYSDNGRSSSTTNLTMSSTSSYYYGTSYTFNTTTGYYSLSGTTSSGVWSESFVNLYTCKSTSSSGTCSTLYYTSSYTDTTHAVAYSYSRTYHGSTSYDEAHANTKDSTIKTYIDNWYTTNFTNSDITSKLEDTIFCNDRSTKAYNSSTIGYTSFSSYGALGYGTNATLYGAAHRASYYASNSSPSLVCINNNDKFTVSTSNGNGELTNPVGLITLDEAVLAGYNTYYSDTSNYTNATNYLYTSKWYWTFSPVRVNSRGYADVGSVNSYVSNDGVGDTYGGVRPVVSLADGTLAESGGDGSTTNPYVVK